MASSHKIAVALILSVMAIACSPFSVSASAEEADTIQYGWKIKNGKHYYYNEDGTKATGETEIDGITYLFGYSGALKTDWQTINGKRYYFDPVSGSPVYGWMDYFDSRYYISETEGKLTGLQCVEDEWYQFEEDGALKEAVTQDTIPDTENSENQENQVIPAETVPVETETTPIESNADAVSGWYETEEGKLYYADPETNQPIFGMVEVDGKHYYITEESGVLHGARYINNNVYVFSQDDGSAVSSWYNLGDDYYYFDSETLSKKKGLLRLGDKLYYLSEDDGHMMTGWIDTDGSQYYFGSDGVALTGLVHINDFTYYFAEDGKMLTGFQNIDGVSRYFDEVGAMLTGWLNLEDGRYYFDETGSQLFGFQNIDGTTYYFADGGKAISGLWDILGNTYYFHESGAMAVGLTDIGNNTYYFDENGICCYGLQEINGTTYYFHEGGTMAKGETIDIDNYHYRFLEDGSLDLKYNDDAIMLDVVSFKQFDTQWKNTSLGNSTIGSIGCLLTSMSMLESYKTNTVITPPSMKQLMNFTSGGALSNWNDIVNMGYTVETYNEGISQDVMKRIYSALLNNHPVMFGSKQSNGNQHYVVVTGYTAAPTVFLPECFLINDPGSSWNNYLSEHLAKFPNVYKLVY